MKRLILAAAAAVLSIGLAACSSGTSTSTGVGTSGTSTPAPVVVNNVQPIVVDAGPTFEGQQIGTIDEPFTTVIICAPGTATCQSIDHVLVDTGSSGLRILSSEIAMTLPFLTDAGNNPLGNCIQYADTTFQWGPMVNVDIKMAGEVASVPMQIVGPTNFPAPPTVCSAGGTAANTVLSLGANGILGVGLFRQDCGPACASTAPPAVYFSCPSSGCVTTSVAVNSQLQNPVWLFPQDNNGLAIILPQVGAGGALSVSGSMIFGIGTQTNNGLVGALAQAANEDTGNFTTTFNGVAYTNSYIDSGSSGFFFLDSATTGLPDCSSTGDASGFYCPTTPVNFTAITTGPNPNGSNTAISQNIAFSIADALTFIDDTSNTAFNNIGGPGGPTTVFDWGLPFFFGRTVFIGIEGQSSAAGTGPYWAY